jgi:hypothetical protein
MSSPIHHEGKEPQIGLNRRLLLQGVIVGAAYGILLRFILGRSDVDRWTIAHGVPSLAAIMTSAFLMLGPFVMGLLTVSRFGSRSPIPVWKWIFAPWIAVILMMLALAAAGFEGWICIVMALPIALVFSSLGGIVAAIFQRIRKRRLSTTAVSCFALLPFVIAPLEARLPSANQTRTVSSEILIHASPDTIWRNIERVPAISPTELQPTWTHRIGFPRPIAATLSFEGVGGVRHATFERGLLFIETITAWQPNHRLAFHIKADTAHIPPTTLDEHVTIGGRYFDVLDGEYTLEPLPNGDTILHLSSQERLSTDFNGYAGLWTDAVMQSLQSNILHVIRNRCEATPIPQTSIN